MTALQSLGAVLWHEDDDGILLYRARKVSENLAGWVACGDCPLVREYS